MSRGHGKTQQAILDALAAGQPVHVCELAWRLAEQAGSVAVSGSYGPLPAGRIDRSFYSGFRRAIKGLRGSHGKAGPLRWQPRKLLDLGDVVAHYPFKAQALEVRELRHRLLPHLASEQATGTGRFSITEIEKRIFSEMPDDRLSELRLGWAPLEDRLVHLLPDSSEPRRTLLINLVAKARELLRPRWPTISHTDSFDSFLRRIRKLTTDGDLVDDLSAFYDACVPPIIRQQRRMRSKIEADANFQIYARSRLHGSAKSLLLKAVPDLLRALPGHRDPGPSPRGWADVGGASFDPILDSLLRRDVLGPFHFVSLA